MPRLPSGAGASNKAGLLGLTFEVDGVPLVSKVLGVAAKSVRNLEPVWNDIYDDFRARESRVFAAQGNVQGYDAWTPLNPTYKEWKQEHGFDTRILIKTGAMMNSLTRKGASGSVFRPGPMRVEMGTSVPYAVYHQSDRPRKQKKGGGDRLPRRTMFRVTDTQRRHWVRLIQAFILMSGQFERENLGAMTRKGDWRSRADAGFSDWAGD
jgi:phage gpG-like protein